MNLHQHQRHDALDARLAQLLDDDLGPDDDDQGDDEDGDQ